MSYVFQILDKLAKLDEFSMVPGPDHPGVTADCESKFLERYLVENAPYLHDSFYVHFLRVCAEFYLQDASSEDFALRSNGTVLSFGATLDEAMDPDLDQAKFPFCYFGFVSKNTSQGHKGFVDVYFAESNAGSSYNGVWVQTHWGTDQTTWRYFCGSFASWLDLLIECEGDFRKTAPWRGLGLES
jgi:hypothetical protein